MVDILGGLKKNFKDTNEHVGRGVCYIEVCPNTDLEEHGERLMCQEPGQKLSYIKLGKHSCYLTWNNHGQRYQFTVMSVNSCKVHRS